MSREEPPAAVVSAITIEPVPDRPKGNRRRDFSQMRELHEYVARALLRGERVADIANRTRCSHQRLEPVIDGTSRYLRPSMARQMRELSRQRRNGSIMQPAEVQAPCNRTEPDEPGELAQLRRTVLLQALELAALKDPSAQSA